ncbi:MAG: RNA polymerase sigma factor [Candidatus Zixiibacteriota bacterium]
MAQAQEVAVQSLQEIEHLYRTALYVLNDKAQAENLVGKSIVSAYRLWLETHVGADSKDWLETQVRSGNRVWLFRIMTNFLIAHQRPAANLKASILNPEETDISQSRSSWRLNGTNAYANEGFLASLSDDDVSRAIAGLPDNCRLVTVLSLAEGFTYREISDITGLDLNKVRTRIHHGRDMISASLARVWRSREGGSTPGSDLGSEQRNTG